MLSITEVWTLKDEHYWGAMNSTLFVELYEIGQLQSITCL
jgi:hypothetical protein